jgi:hypothetical protein
MDIVDEPADVLLFPQHSPGMQQLSELPLNAILAYRFLISFFIIGSSSAIR